MIDPLTQEKTDVVKPKWIKSGSSSVVLISFSKPICIQKFENGNRLGRFILRDEGKTIATGCKVIRYKPLNATDKKVADLAN